MTHMSKALSSVTFANSNPVKERLNNIRDYMYHDVQLGFDVGDEERFNFYAGGRI